ncbi:MAG TPA: hypothetical protein VMU83_20570 [Hanamia sp.]|nr:hypothetical protein [Hanamia sp.]
MIKVKKITSVYFKNEHSEVNPRMELKLNEWFMRDTKQGIGQASLPRPNHLVAGLSNKIAED